LRAVEPEDLEWVHQWENNTDIWQVSHTLAPFSKYVIHQYLEQAHLDIFEAKQLRLVIELKGCGRPLGAFDLFDLDSFHSRLGLGVLIHDKEDRKKGFAQEALELVLDYCFRTLCLEQVYCNVGSKNEASKKLFSSAGFKLVGIKRNWLKTYRGWEDEEMFQLLKADYKLEK